MLGWRSFQRKPGLWTFRPKLQIKVLRVPELDNGVMVGPRFFEAMRELLHGLDSFRAQDEKASHRSTDATDHP